MLLEFSPVHLRRGYQCISAHHGLSMRGVDLQCLHQAIQLHQYSAPNSCQITSGVPVTRQYKLNTDESPGVATEYGIRSIPTVMLFKGGVKLDTVIGAVPKATLVQTLEKYID